MKLRILLLTAACILGLQTLIQAETVKIGVFPSNEPAKLYQVMEYFGDYLSEKTGDDISVIVSHDYTELGLRFREGSIDIAWLNTLTYVRLKSVIPGIRYLATYMERNERTGEIIPYYRSNIVSLKSSGFSSLEDIRDRLFAFTDPSSTSGYAYPNMMLKQRGIDPESYFRKVFYLRQHDRVVEALRHGSIAAGAISDGTLSAAIRRYGDIFTVLAESDPIPLDAIVSTEVFPSVKIKAYRDALLSMPGDHQFLRAMKETLGWNAAGFAVLDNAFYDSVREALKQ
ncbi:hypothetical protein B4O97_06880 [Marispirochaeta aestuarii]|uniref:Solute-binding protein family 3/N-terminal domain-containing protein n=1 Tax=Marispirochaeta aestuarii TaxID=1963862 RepID=A0A1Y1RZY4_9SPIO|nr:hypothetical protein B4O97_06880 [Marispirochaeta aestuarii]